MKLLNPLFLAAALGLTRLAVSSAIPGFAVQPGPDRLAITCDGRPVAT